MGLYLLYVVYVAHTCNVAQTDGYCYICKAKRSTWVHGISIRRPMATVSVSFLIRLLFFRFFFVLESQNFEQDAPKQTRLYSRSEPSYRSYQIDEFLFSLTHFLHFNKQKCIFNAMHKHIINIEIL